MCQIVDQAREDPCTCTVTGGLSAGERGWHVWPIAYAGAIWGASCMLYKKQWFVVGWSVWTMASDAPDRLLELHMPVDCVGVGPLKNSDLFSYYNLLQWNGIADCRVTEAIP